MIRAALASGTALTLSLGLAAPVLAQATPGDRSGTPTPAGTGQSAASVTNAPAPSVNAASAAPVPATTAPTPNPAVAARGRGNAVGEIIVTARRVQERLQDVPISITVFNQQQLNNRNITQAGDLATYTPSLSANRNFGAQNTTFAIRGFTQEINTTPSVGVYFADVPAPRGAGTTPSGNGAGPGSFFDLQNVQILKGPQGTLFGINTTGGSILFVPQKPTSEFGGYIEASGGSYGLERIQAVVNAPINDKIRFRVGVDHESRDGYARNDSGIGPSSFDDINYTAARASLVVDVTPNIENYTIGSFSYSSTNGTVPRLFAGASTLSRFPGPLAVGQINTQAALGNGITEQLTTTSIPNPNGSGTIADPVVIENAKGSAFYRVQNDVANPESVLSEWQLINTTTWRYSDNLTIKNIASYAQLRDIERDSIFGTQWSFETAPSPFNLFGTGGVQFNPVQPGPGADTAHQSTATEEIQFQGNAFDQRLVWQAGGFSEISEPLSQVGATSPQLISCTNIGALQCTDFLAPLAGRAVGEVGFQTEGIQYIDAGIYGQGTYALTDKLKFTAGARYTWDHSSSLSNIGFYDFPTPNNPVGFCQSVFVRDPLLPIASQSDCQQRFHQISQAPTYTFDLDYKPIDDVLLYAKYARGYRQGSVNPNAAEGYNTFNQEKVDTYEVGTKNTFRWPIRGTFDVTGFYNAFQQQQIQVGLLSSTNSVQENIGVVNAGRSQIYGAEVETTLYPFDGFSLNVSYAYLNTLLESLSAPPFVAGSRYDTFAFTSTAGGELPLSPKNKVSLTGAYILPLSSDIGAVTVGATFTYTSRQLVTQSSPFATLSPTRLLNLDLNWVSVFRKPVDISVFATNVTQDHYFNYVGGLYDPAGFDSGQLGEPRMYGVRVKYHFGAGR